MQKILIKNIKGLVQAGEDIPLIRKGKDMQELPIVKNAFLYLEDNEVIAYGKMDDWKEIGSSSDIEIIDAEGCFVLPAFCDSHTHTVFAKTREEEFVDRIHGMSYEEIALKGGGILNSARNLQAMSEDDLYIQAFERLNFMMQHGTGAVEIKSGYGLTVEAELKMLRVIKQLKKLSPIPIKSTFLAAHTYPTSYKDDHKGYIDLIINEMLPVIAKETMAYSGLTGVMVISYFSNEIVYQEGTVKLRMNFAAHFNKDNLIDRYYTYYDRSGIIEIMNKNILD